MGKRNELEERINFVLTGDLAFWLKGLKEQGYYTSNPDAVRQGLILLQDHLNKLGVKVKNLKKGED